MPTNFVIDQAASFRQAVLVQSDPKLRFGSDVQETTKGTAIPVWTVQVLVSQEQFGRLQNEIVKVTIASPKDPQEGIPPFSPVRLHNLQVGVMATSKRDKETGAETVTGAGVYFRADRIEAAIQNVPNGRKPEHANAN